MKRRGTKSNINVPQPRLCPPKRRPQNGSETLNPAGRSSLDMSSMEVPRLTSGQTLNDDSRISALRANRPKDLDARSNPLASP